MIILPKSSIFSSSMRAFRIEFAFSIVATYISFIARPPAGRLPPAKHPVPTFENW